MQGKATASTGFLRCLSLSTENIPKQSVPTELITADGSQGPPETRTPDGLLFLNDKHELSSPHFISLSPKSTLPAAASLQIF